MGSRRRPVAWLQDEGVGSSRLERRRSRRARSRSGTWSLGPAAHPIPRRPQGCRRGPASRDRSGRVPGRVARQWMMTPGALDAVGIGAPPGMRSRRVEQGRFVGHTHSTIGLESIHRCVMGLSHPRQGGATTSQWGFAHQTCSRRMLGKPCNCFRDSLFCRVVTQERVEVVDGCLGRSVSHPSRL